MPAKYGIAILLAAMLAACGEKRTPVTMHPSGSPPARLSEWGILHADGKTLEMNAGVIPYDLNTPLFSDYALKLRTVWMPDGQAAQYREDREFDFPVGTILSKTFHYRLGDTGFQKLDAEATLSDDGALNLESHRIIETRLLVRYEDGWQALPYVWNAEQNEASLEVAGAQFEFSFDGDSFAYLVPDMNQCSACHVTDHSSKEVRPLGPKAHQLNREFSFPDDGRNQLDHWQETGLLVGVPAAPPASARWSERSTAPVAELARVYLDVNCAHCHNPDGAADTSALNLNLEAPVDRQFGVCKPPVAVGRGSGNRPYDIFPGRPDDSILLFRMEHDDPAIMMPELGRATSHEEGVAQVRAWIEALPGDC
jgi:uncharacterized repeat protein (TIGR03806 family)